MVSEVTSGSSSSSSSSSGSSSNIISSSSSSSSGSSSNISSNIISSSSRMAAGYDKTEKQEKQLVVELQSHATPGRWHVQILAAMAASLAVSQCVVASCIGSVVVDQIKQGWDTVPATDSQLTFYLVSFFIGAAMGAIAGGVVGARFGPRNVILATVPPNFICWLAEAMVPGIQLMTAVRLAQGVFAGLATSLAIPFIANMSSPRYRGFLVTLMPETTVILSMVVVFVSGRFLAWRTCMMGSGFIICSLLASAMSLLPSDPSWLLARGRLEEARRSLLFYRGRDADMSVVKEAEAATETTQARSTLQLLATLRQRRFLLPVLYAAIVMTGQVWSGNAVIQNYAVLFFRRVGVSVDPFLLTVVVSLSRLPVLMLSAALVDRCGRRPLLIVSALGMAACHLSMVAYFLLPGVATQPAVVIVSLIGATCFFQLGVSPIAWILLGELMPSHLAELCGGWVTCFFFSVTVAQLQMFPALLAILGEPGVFALWAALMLALATFTLVLLPETSGLTSSEIEDMFRLYSPLQGVTKLAARVVGIPVGWRHSNQQTKQPPIVFV